MRYGYDHCRICGKPIVIRRPAMLEVWEAAQRKSPMPEKKWRELGFLAAPTPFQLRVEPADGCCADCGLAITQRTSRYHVRGVASIMGAVMVTVIIGFIIFYMRQ